MPGVVLMFPDKPPPIDPKDRALLKPLAALGKNSSTGPANSVSFLRRTEYMTSLGNKVDGNSVLRSMNSRSQPIRRGQQQPVRKEPEAFKKDPANILRAVEKGFNLAYPRDAYIGDGDKSGRAKGADITAAEKEAWERPRHPTKPNLKLLDSYPVLPDLDAIPDSGSYIVFKYQTNPVKSTSTYDQRLDSMILYPLPPTGEQQSAFEAQLEEHTANPTGVLKPTMPAVDFMAFIPEGGDDVETARENLSKLKRKFDVFDADHDADDLYPHPAGDDHPNPHFKFDKLRAYETYQLTADADALWNDHLAVALHEPRDEEHDVDHLERLTTRQKAAYLYPIMQRTLIRPRRNVTVGVGISRQARPLTEEEKVDQLGVTIEDMNEEALASLRGIIRPLDPVAAEDDD
jgi:hypothetical protein